MRTLRRSKLQPKKTKGLRAGEPVVELNQDALPPRPDSIAAAAIEEPLPFVMGEMVLWGVGVATLLLPISLMGLVASPFLAAGNIFLPTRAPAMAA